MLNPVAYLGIAVMSCVMSVAVLGSLLKAQVAGLPRWFCAYFLLAVAMLLLVAFIDTAAPWLIVTVNSMLVVGAALVLQGTRQFFGRPVASRAEWAGLVLLIAGIAWWTLVSPNAGARIALTSLAYVYVRAVVGWLAWRWRPRSRPQYSYLFLVAAAWLGVAVHLARAIVYGLGIERQTTLLDPSPVNIVLLGLIIVSLPSLSIALVMVAHDRLAERMERLATIDELTGALVRRAFIEQAAARISALSAQAAKAQPVSIAILDLDHFKAVNDRYGHAAGDRALACFAAVIAQAVGRADLFGRLGGEEFAVLFASRDKADAQRATNALRAALAEAAANEAACTFSAGIEQVGTGDTLAAVMARADAALYAAKAMGRNCVVAARPLDDKLLTQEP
ncbi:GGDEF domain-containing protein [Trinickia caryophylli]|uniref:diguanylate cyclase n=1 Tax=Trinickia caryophylli TaxID=28094 RepID=A0A1X7EUZ2_TRICW|nr:GGDEF domain-containing protein [Trinickia caryophylli]PMS12171.1 GGDEF domain-containing protein [Trinickia caryophylli]TRX18522.1 GGDEF domain-containing protein [Trinickia caryophylli]WQE10688.1 GGDEF domain-containing protein [Trinickia caryophylli]SMF40312.1 diguanylate cyclase (GGDEF) domain-containing protein [Trinickia caryophylli]GLU33059.1 GGDEF domain-containing protein [Trinickia caryophylli]